MLIRRVLLSAAGVLALSRFAAVDLEHPQASTARHPHGQTIKTRSSPPISTEVEEHAEQGHEDPCGMTKLHFENHTPPTVQQITAFSNLLRDAERGTPKSQLELANAYCEAKAYVDADMWYRLAQANPDTREEASRGLKLLESSVMTSLGVAQAEFRAEQWHGTDAKPRPQGKSAEATDTGGRENTFNPANIAVTLSLLALVLTLTVFAFVRTATRRALRDAGLL